LHPPKSGRYEFTKKIKFSLQKDDLEMKIKQLDEATQTLRRIRETGVSREVTLQLSSTNISNLNSSLSAIRNSALRLYSAISSSYIVDCHPEHEAMLFLQSLPRLMEKQKQVMLKRATLKFTIAFPPSDLTVGHPACYKTHISVLEDDDVDETYGPLECRLPSRLILTCECTSTILAHRTTPSITLPVQPARPRPKDLNDLCRYFQQAKDDGHYLELFLSRKGCLCFSHTSQRPSVALTAASLADIFSLDQILQGPVPWTLNQRMAISFRVASSILQLNSTPWLGQALTSENLCFIRGTVSDNPEPFIRRRFSKNPPSAVNNREGPKRCMLELGIILLELWYAKSFTVYAAENGLPVTAGDSFGDRYNGAIQWVDFSTFHILPCYLDVIKRCVERTFATSGPVLAWDDVVFRKSVCELVLKPLWENCPVELRSA
jgi:hypothetical protein